MSGGYECECSPQRRSPKPNGTCANCGHWLPGEREKGPDLAAIWGGKKERRTDAEVMERCETCNHKWIDHIIDGGCLKSGCVCTGFAATNECGAGLHFSQSPTHAKDYFPEAKRFLACKVKASEAVFIDTTKIKAPRCKVIGEVNLFDASPLKENQDNA